MFSGRSLESDGRRDSQSLPVESAMDAAIRTDHLPTMWLGAQSGRSLLAE